MAKWGQGDPRWIVEERSDATNVNNWHWTERDASCSSKEHLKELLVGLKIQDDKGECEVIEMTSIEGEASASNRKAKLIFFYEWNIKLEWQGNLKDCSTKLKGHVEIPNLSDENDLDQIDITVTTKKNTEESRILKEIMRSKGTTVIREQLGKYITFLKEDMSKGMILPSADTQKESQPAVSKPTPPKASPSTIQQQHQVNQENMKNTQIGVQIDTQNLTATEEFKCAAEELYQVLTDPQRVSAFTQSQAVMEVENGGKFSLFGGNVTGEFISLDRASHKIVQRWRFKTWPEAHFSTVTIKLTQKSDCTKLTLNQTGIPVADYDRTKAGWINYYWHAIMATFGYGAQLF
ncbi:activator of 90 kDa heat shock protein ATPase homolog 1-like [Patiria miniata]|uniref:Activator of Hsp90 ATPase AHSA1-like N-terminal domain-containing protein n=1 Tax=Patiria miniata TaxID=46514 RepID=A0A914B7Q0_PATMI|nr:activator of 90 kDa heat shock protein ATPase homolog 1-like [Patiria miniata]